MRWSFISQFHVCFCLAEVFPKNNGSRALEIVKCIVYGGLVESITSLSVVSSAAASDVTTCNNISSNITNNKFIKWMKLILISCCSEHYCNRIGKRYWKPPHFRTKREH